MLKISTHEATKGFACRTRARLSDVRRKSWNSPGGRRAAHSAPTITAGGKRLAWIRRAALTEVNAQRRRSSSWRQGHQCRH
jgi:hypothetical protein